jgi:hypothetical protein
MVGLSCRCAFGVAGNAGTLGDACPTLGLDMSTLGGEERCCVSSRGIVTWDGMLVGVGMGIPFCNLYSLVF